MDHDTGIQVRHSVRAHQARPEDAEEPFLADPPIARGLGRSGPEPRPRFAPPRPRAAGGRCSPKRPRSIPNRTNTPTRLGECGTRATSSITAICATSCTNTVHWPASSSGIPAVMHRAWRPARCRAIPAACRRTCFPSARVFGAECDEDDIRALINMYVLAAQRAQDAGFDILELSVADNTVPAQFLDHRYNYRSDGWGGSLKNRLRFAVECLTELREACGSMSAISIRYETDDILGALSLPVFRGGAHCCRAAPRRRAARRLVGQDRRLRGMGGRGRGELALPQIELDETLRRGRKKDRGRRARDQQRPLHPAPDDMIGVINERQCDIIGAARPSIADTVPAEEDRGGAERGHPRVHRVQHVRLAHAAAGAFKLHPERDLGRGVSPGLASREIRAGE